MPLDIKDYPHAIKPFRHQHEHFEKHAYDKEWGLLWEQGTAKTKPLIDTAILLYKNNKIDTLIVVAPPGVERNWMSDELPKHVPAEYADEVAVRVFTTKGAGSKWQQEEMNKLYNWRGLSVLLISYNAFMTKKGKNTVWKFLRGRMALYVLDEAHYIKSPGAKRTFSINASSVYAEYRRILTGTPVAIGPFDLYSQFKFLQQDIWLKRGIGGAKDFRHYFGEWLFAEEVLKESGYDPGYDQLLNYKRLDTLAAWISEVSDRHLKEDVLDLPPKLYSKRYFDLTPKQRAVYDQFKSELVYEFESGTIIEGDLPIVKMLRLQQIACGYVPTEDPINDEPFEYIDDKNPRLGLIEEMRDNLHHPAIIWSRFTNDTNQILDILGKKAVRYDGTIDDDEAERNKLMFQDGSKQFFCGNPQKGAAGLTLHMAKTMFYYSNSYRLIDRLQSEDRAHRAGMSDTPLGIVDACAIDTVDAGIINNLRDKREISSELLGDEWREWI